MVEHSKEKIFITGITGFTGKHLERELLDSGFLVYGSTYSSPNCKTHFQCNILKKTQLSEILNEVRPDYVIHLAAISFVASENIDLMYRTNILGSLNVLEVLEELNLKIKKIIIASSAAIYGNIGSVLSEDMCPKPVNHYGNSKLAMENMVANYYEKFDIIITRPFNYTGVGQESNFLVPKIVSHFKDEKSEIDLGNLYTNREYNDVRTWAIIYKNLLLSDYKSGVVNISSGKTFKIKDILEILEKLSSTSIKVNINEKFVRKNEIQELKGSPNKLISIIGNTPLKYSLEDTLKEMYLN